MNRTYNLNLGNGTSGSDNGNIISITNGLVSARSQNFTYDWLNRITAAYSTGTNWGETYTIDTWGNLTNIGPYPGKTPLGNLNCAGGNAKNQLSTCFGYDAAGNMTSNGFNTYTYDAENRLIVANGVFYFYDGDGNRVAKCDVGTCQVGSTGTFYWRGVDGNTLVESDVAGSFQYEYIFFDGRRVARRSLTGSEPIYYYFSDHLGTHSIVTDGYGDVENESDFSPYGEEIFITDTLSPQNYKFTGKERDTESGNDYFGARYYSSAMGRFMSPDWAAKPVTVPYAHFGNPQSLNLYSYVQNNPTTVGDPDGHGDATGGYCDPNACHSTTGTPMSDTEKQIDTGILELGSAFFTGGATLEALEAGAALKTAIGAIATSGLAVSGSTRIIATASGEKPENIEQGTTAVTTLSTPVGMAVTVGTGGNLKAGAVASDVSSAASIAAKPAEAVKDPAGTALTVSNVVQDVKAGINAVKGLLSPPAPPPPPPPPPPRCTGSDQCH